MKVIIFLPQNVIYVNLIHSQRENFKVFAIFAHMDINVRVTMRNLLYKKDFKFKIRIYLSQKNVLKMK